MWQREAVCGLCIASRMCAMPSDALCTLCCRQLVVRHRDEAADPESPAASASEASADEDQDQENITPPKRKRQQGGGDAKPRGKAKKAAAAPVAGRTRCWMRAGSDWSSIAASVQEWVHSGR